MQVKQISPERTFAVVFATGEEVMAGLQRFAQEHGLDAGYFSAIGALNAVTVAFFDYERKEYQQLPPIDQQVEVLSLNGNIALRDGKPMVHAHIVVGKRDGTAHGGHLMKAFVRPTLEVVVTEPPAHLRRQVDPETDLPLLKL